MTTKVQTRRPGETFDERIALPDGTHRVVTQMINEHGVKVRMACVSCEYCKYNMKEKQRQCKKHGGEIPEHYSYSCASWKPKDYVLNAGNPVNKNTGRVLSAHFIAWLKTNIDCLLKQHDELVKRTPSAELYKVPAMSAYMEEEYERKFDRAAREEF